MYKLLWIGLLSLLAMRVQSQSHILGEWELVGVSAQNVSLPKLQGAIRLHLYSNHVLLLRSEQGGNSDLVGGRWEMDSLAVLHLYAGEQTFHWRISIIDQQNMVLRDVEDNAHISFSRAKHAKDPLMASESKMMGQWFLVEAGGKDLSKQDLTTPNLNLQAEQQLVGKAWNKFDTGKWSLTEDGRFLELSTLSREVQYYEIVYLDDNSLLLSDKSAIFAFQKTEIPSEPVRQLTKKIIGTWMAKNPQLPVLKAYLVFRKDGTLEGISNLNSEVRRWELSSDGKNLKLLPYLENSEDVSYNLRLRFIDKNTLLLSDSELSVLFIKERPTNN